MVSAGNELTTFVTTVSTTTVASSFLQEVKNMNAKETVTINTDFLIVF
jgi:hypothetical protein